MITRSTCLPRREILASHRVVHLIHKAQNGGPLENDSVLRTCGNEFAEEGVRRPPGVSVPCYGPAYPPSATVRRVRLSHSTTMHPHKCK